MVNDEKRKMKKKDAQDRILMAAKKEFARKGFSGTRMSTISSKASVNSALIHYYFKNKKNLYTEVLKRIIHAEVDPNFSILPDNIEYSAPVKLLAILYFAFKSNVELTDTDTMKIILWEMAEGGKYLDPLVRTYNQPRFNNLIKIFNEGVAAGDFIAIDPFFIIFQMHSFLFMYYINFKGVIESSIQDFFKENDDDVYQYLIENIFRQLIPPGKEIIIPELPPKLKNYLDEILAIMKRDADPNVSFEAVKNLKNILTSQ